jgi:nicotinamide mononucleotide adenylyltransferase
MLTKSHPWSPLAIVSQCVPWVIEDTKNFTVDSWEALRCNEAGQSVYTKTVDVLKDFDHEINEVLSGIQIPEGTYKRAQIVLLIGADVAMKMGDPNICTPSEIHDILGGYGAFIVERPAQVDIERALGPLRKFDKIWVVRSSYNDISSLGSETKYEKEKAC